MSVLGLDEFAGMMMHMMMMMEMMVMNRTGIVVVVGLDNTGRC